MHPVFVNTQHVVPWDTEDNIPTSPILSVQSDHRPPVGLSILTEVNHRPESIRRMVVLPSCLSV